MAILIQRNITTPQGFSTNQIYTRLVVTNNYQGKTILVETKNYISKEAYQSNPLTGEIPVSKIPTMIEYEYDRAINGVDSLFFAHEKTIEAIKSRGYIKQISVDPSTGEETSGYVLEDPWIVDSSISIIDISIG